MDYKGYTFLDNILGSKLELPIHEWDCRFECDDEETELMHRNNCLTLRSKFAVFLQKTFGHLEIPEQNHMYVAPSFETCWDYLFDSISKPGDVYLSLGPLGPAVEKSILCRNKIELVHSDLLLKQQLENFKASELVTSASNIMAGLQALQETHDIKGVILSNPLYKVGSVLEPDVITMIWDFCKESDLHLICNETLSFIMDDQDYKFNGLFAKVQNSSWENVHIIWDMCEVFRLHLMPMGTMLSTNPVVAERWPALSALAPIPTMCLSAYQVLTADPIWVKREFLNKRDELMRRARVVATRLSSAFGWNYRLPAAGKEMCVCLNQVLEKYEDRDAFVKQLIEETKGTLNFQEIWKNNWFSITYFAEDLVLFKGIEIVQGLYKNGRLPMSEAILANTKTELTVELSVQSSELSLVSNDGSYEQDEDAVAYVVQASGSSESAGQASIALTNSSSYAQAMDVPSDENLCQASSDGKDSNATAPPSGDESESSSGKNQAQAAAETPKAEAAAEKIEILEASGGASSDEGLKVLAQELFDALKTDTNWVKEHTVDKLEEENPSLLYAMREILEDK